MSIWRVRYLFDIETNLISHWVVLCLGGFRFSRVRVTNLILGLPSENLSACARQTPKLTSVVLEGLDCGEVVADVVDRVLLAGNLWLLAERTYLAPAAVAWWSTAWTACCEKRLKASLWWPLWCASWRCWPPTQPDTDS